MFKRSCEDLTRIYICLFGRRYIFEEGKYVGWYHPELNKVIWKESTMPTYLVNFNMVSRATVTGVEVKCDCKTVEEFLGMF